MKKSNLEVVFDKLSKQLEKLCDVLEKINMYLFYKVVFLSICFLPWYNGAHYIYNSFLKGWFTSYEKTVYK